MAHKYPDHREHLPSAPLGYRWQTEINLSKDSGGHGYGMVSLVQTSWSQLNPRMAPHSFGLAAQPGESADSLYRRLIQFAWIGEEIDEARQELEQRRDELDRKAGWKR